MRAIQSVYNEPKNTLGSKQLLFNLLLDEDPEETFEDVSKSHFSFNEVIDSVISEISKILNTRLTAKFDDYEELKDDPLNAFVYVSLSEYYNSVNKPEKALESIVSALKSEQLDVDTKVQVLGQYVEKLLKDSTKLVETESLFKLLVDRYPLEEQVHGYYAVFIQYQKRNAEAISELETMININQKNDQTWMRLIQFYIGDKNYKQILTITSRAIENLPKLPVWYFYRGIAQFQLADYKNALETYQTGLPLIPAEQAALKSDFYAQIADSYFKLEKKDSAFANYERSLEANQKNIMVMNINYMLFYVNI